MSTPETQAQRQGSAPSDNGVAGSRDTLSVTDNRTGATYELPVTDGTVRAMDLRQIKTGEDDFGLMAYDPAYTNTASCRSSITYIDGEAGILQHRGYPIEQLCEHSTYLEVAYLLIHGELPTTAQLESWIDEITIHTFVHENVKDFMQGFRYDANPMGMLVASVGALSTFYPDANQIHDEDVRAIQIIRLLAKMPTLAAFAFRHNMGQPYVYPDNDLDYAGNFLGMMYKMTELKYQPDPRLERALDVLFILHADHEQNASTSAVRSVGSTQVDPYSAVAAGVAALYGPLHGGANEAALRMLARIEHGREHPRLPGGRQGGQRAADGVRPPGLQELRSARADHPQIPRRRVRGARQEPLAGRRDRAREAGAGRRLLHLAQAVSERGLLLGPDLRGAGPAGGDVPGDVRDRAHLAAGSHSGWRWSRTPSRRSPARARSTRASAIGTTSRSHNAASGPMAKTGKDAVSEVCSAHVTQPIGLCAPDRRPLDLRSSVSTQHGAMPAVR